MSEHLLESRNPPFLNFLSIHQFLHLPIGQVEQLLTTGHGHDAETVGTSIVLT